MKRDKQGVDICDEIDGYLSQLQFMSEECLNGIRQSPSKIWSSKNIKKTLNIESESVKDYTKSIDFKKFGFSP